MAHILVTQPSDGPRRPHLIEALESEGHDVLVVDRPDPILKNALKDTVDIAFVDVAFLELEALDLIAFLKGINPHMEIITLADPGRIREAALTIRRGASLYLVDPIEPEMVEQLVLRAGNRQQNAVVVHQVQKRTLEGLFGSSPAMTRLFRTVLKVAPTDATVLITGESGTGKELLAQVIHRLSKRSSQRLVAVNCAAIPENLLESELFGHVKGSFTGASQDKRGLIEEADGGTCILDEVGELPLSLQVKLLRFLQDRSLRRVGATSSRRIDVRILAATNRDLAAEIREGNFREDLFYRLNVINLHLLPLRQRMETLPTLIPHLLGRLCPRHDKMIVGLAPDAMRALSAYDFPGNIRELENILEYAVIMAEGDQINRQDLPPQITDGGLLMIEEVSPAVSLDSGWGSPMVLQTPGAAPPTLEEMELSYVEAVLEQVGGNQSEAARILGISRTSLWRKLKKIEKSPQAPDDEAPDEVSPEADSPEADSSEA